MKQVIWWTNWEISSRKQLLIWIRIRNSAYYQLSKWQSYVWCFLSPNQDLHVLHKTRALRPATKHPLVPSKHEPDIAFITHAWSEMK